MTATTSANRVTPYFAKPRNPQPVLPVTPADREDLLADAVFAAVAALQGLLTHADQKVVLRAAEMILNLENTRQRHGRVMIGMETETVHPRSESGLGTDRRTAVGGPPQRAAPPNPSDVGAALCGGPPVRSRRTDVSNPLDLFIEQMRQELQAQEDADGTGVIVSRSQAEECARYIQANMHRTPVPPAGHRCHEGDPTPAGRGGRIDPGRVVSPRPGGTFDRHPDVQR